MLLALVCLPLPIISPENDADTSLVMLLDHARAQGLQFGVDFVNTYGPLGFLAFPYFSPEGLWPRLLAGTLFSLATTTGLCLLAWRLRPMWRLSLLAAFLWITSNLRMSPELWLHVMFLSWGLLCFLQEGKHLVRCALVAAGLAGCCALAKVSFLIVGCAYVALLAAEVWARGQRRLAIGLPVAFAGVFLLGWWGMGQHIENLPAFIQTALCTVQGYNAALGFEAKGSLSTTGWVLFLATAFTLAMRCLIVAGELSAKLRRLALLGLTGLLCFVSWKHGLVRADSYHVSMFFGFLPILMLSLEVLPVGSPRVGRWFRGIACLIALASALALQHFCLRSVAASAIAPWHAAALNAQRLLTPVTFHREAKSRFDAHRQAARLPEFSAIVGNSPVDVFGFRQAYALFNGMNLRPRPVSQSYAACNAELMRINERFVLGPNGADYFLFELHPLDNKFPALEDAMVLRTLTLNFAPVAAEGRFVLLKRISSVPPRITLLRELEIGAGEPLDLREFAMSNLWIEIHLAPSFLGRLRQVLAQPPAIRLAAWTAPGGELVYRHPARQSLLASGFVASPLLRWTRDILDSARSAPRPGAYTIELNGLDKFWKPRARVRVFAIDSATGAQNAAPKPSSTQEHSQPFRVFPDLRWRPDLPAPGGAAEILAYGVIVLLPAVGIGALVMIAKRRKTSPGVSKGQLIVGNVLVFATLLGVAWVVAETWFRFFHDTTDALASTRVSQRWVERHWKLNLAGCRDDIEYSPAIAGDKRRLTFIGDSFTAGHGVKSVRDRFTNILRAKHPNWEVHALANLGLDTGAQTVLINRMAAKGYAFDDVVLVYCLNDVSDLVVQRDEALARALNSLNAGTWWTRNSYALNWLTLRYKAARSPHMRDYFAFVKDAYEGELWERQKVRLREFRAAVESRGGKLRVVTFPFLHAAGADYPYVKAHASLREFWRQEGVPHSDLLSAFSNRAPQELVVNAFDAHPNELAHRLASEALDKFLFNPDTSNMTRDPATQ